MEYPSEARLQFDLQSWKPAPLGAPYIDINEFLLLRNLSQALVNSETDLARVEKELPSSCFKNGLTYYLLASKAAEAGLGIHLLDLLERGNNSPALYIPTALPVPLADTAYMIEVRKIPRYPLYWSHEKELRPEQEPLIADALRRLVLCAPVTYLKILLGIASWQAILAEARKRHFRKLQIGLVFETYKYREELRRSARTLKPHSDVVGKSLQELEKEFRQEIEKVIPISDPEFRVLCAGIPLDDEERMQLLNQKAQSDYEQEYENCCRWIEQFRLRVT